MKTAEIPVWRYHLPGLQTIATPLIRDIANALSTEENPLLTLEKLLISVSALPHQKSEQQNLMLRRTAHQIAEDGFATGCGDKGTLFCALARSAGMAVKYIETIDIKWLEHGGEPYCGHVYVSVWNPKSSSWLLTDPTQGTYKNVSFKKDKRVIMVEGIDSWHIGFRRMSELLHAMDQFRLRWLRNQKR
jgi:hypothetical protein